MKYKNLIIKQLIEAYILEGPALGADPVENDVPNVIDDEEYITNIPLEQDTPLIFPMKKKRVFIKEPPPKNFDDLDIEILKIKECIKLREQISANRDDDDQQMQQQQMFQNVDATQRGGEQDPNATSNQQMGQDPNASMGMAQDPNAMMGGDMSGMGGMEDIQGPQHNPYRTASQIGRIYELKKIYNRLLSIEEYLSFTSDIRLEKLRGFISKGIELFEVLISNINPYMKEDQNFLDSIIVLYYKFLLRIYLILKVYYERDLDKEKNKNK